MKQATPKKNAEGWIRHRAGRKCPVEAGVKVDYRMRNGSIDDFGRKSETLDWVHYQEVGDIMAYRLHDPVEQESLTATAVEQCAAAFGDSHADVMESVLSRLDGPLQWRDRIAEIDVEVQARTVERAELVKKLASEGFALIGRINDLLTDAAQKHEDMSDFRKWKVGDLVQVIDPENSDLLAGKAYPISEIEEEIEEEDEIHGLPCLLAGGDTWLYAKNMRWHSRPSA